LQPEELMKQLVEVAQESFEAVNAQIDEYIDGFTKFAGKPPVAFKAEPCVKTFREVYDAAAKNYEGDFDEYLKGYAADLMKVNPEMQDTCVKLMKRIYEMQDEKKPMIIVSIIPPYYPDVNINTEDSDTKKMLECIDEVMKYAGEKHGVKMDTAEYYGISDLCYTWLADGMNFDALFNNLIGVNMFYNFPTESLKEFKVPTLVLGAYGKDLHKYTERLHKQYNFEILPDLYLKYIADILK